MYDLKSDFLKLSKTLTAVVSTVIAFGYFGEPFLEDYVESHFVVYEKKHKKENSEKIKLRDLLSEKMGCDADEVHIELGRMYKNELIERKKIYEAIDGDYNHSKDKRNKIVKEIKYIYPQTVLNYEN
jgi:hypothetical protein